MSEETKLPDREPVPGEKTDPGENNTPEKKKSEKIKPIQIHNLFNAHFLFNREKTVRTEHYRYRIPNLCVCMSGRSYIQDYFIFCEIFICIL